MAFLGFGQEQPFAAAEQDAQDRQTAFQGIKDNLPALGLVMGLSMLARNNGTRSVGQLIGQGGADALNAYGTWQKIQEAKARQEKEDQWKLDEREYNRSQDAFRNSMAEKQFALDEMKTQQEMQIAQQRLALARAGVAAQRQAAFLAAAKEREKEEFDKNHKQVNGVWWDKQPDGTWAESKTLNMYDANGKMIGAKADLGTYNDKLGGFVSKDGTFTPLQLPEGYTPPNAKSGEFFEPGEAAKKELAYLGSLDRQVGSLQDQIEKFKDKGSTGYVIGSLPPGAAARFDPEGVPLRAAIENFRSQVMSYISGASVGEAEVKRLEGFLPTPTDDYATLKRKTAAFQDYLAEKATNWRETYGDHPRLGKMRVMQPKKPSLGSFDN